MPNDAPATKVDLSAAVAEIKEATAAAIGEAIHASETRMQEFARGIETNLLKAYHGYAESNQARLLRLETAEAANAQ